jgi:dethiobiotin synthetase
MASPSPVIVVAGTGTDVGKTHVATAILRAWGARSQVIGYKPIETGLVGLAVGKDARQLGEASTFHVQRPLFGYGLTLPLSPHLAARREGIVLDLARLVAQVEELRTRAEGLLVELAGGLFTPLSRDSVNLDLAKALQPAALLLVAPDRIGVLHDVGATVRAASAAGLPPDAIALCAPLVADPSTGKNAAEIYDITGVYVLATFPRASPDAAVSLAAARVVLDRLTDLVRF